MGPALLIALWWVAYAGTLVDPHLLPSPFATLADTWKNIASGAMTNDFLQTLLRVTYAFAIAAALGVPVGIVLGANESIYRSLEFVIDFFRARSRIDRQLNAGCRRRVEGVPNEEKAFPCRRRPDPGPPRRHRAQHRGRDAARE
jgi:hypothetical protein